MEVKLRNRAIYLTRMLIGLSQKTLSYFEIKVPSIVVR